MPTAVIAKPTRMSQRWVCRLANRSAIAEAMRIPAVAGVSTSPVLIALYPRSCCRNTEMTKNEPCSVSHWMSCVPRPRFAVRLRNIRSATSGTLSFFSRERRCRRNQATIATPMATNSQTGDTLPFGITTVPPIVKFSLLANQPYVLACRTPRTTKNKPTAHSTAPQTSKAGRGPLMPGSVIRGASARITTTTMTCAMNDARQLIALVRMPPISGPAAEPSPAAPLMMPKFFARDRVSGKATVTRM